MFKRHDLHLVSNPTCSKAITDFVNNDFQFYDKDGFELNIAERKYYSAMGYPIEHKILNHCCWQEPWFELEKSEPSLILDHSMFLCRCNYTDEALEQLSKLKNQIPQATYLIQTKVKWGFDFALDANIDGNLFEVLHIEYDDQDYDKFKNKMINFDFIVRHTDWIDAAKKIWQHRQEWEQLKGFDQNNWKSKFLIGWQKSEYTEKSL
jgi:hypothetical protein